jgi:glutaminyl-peptide cyclotransferase
MAALCAGLLLVLFTTWQLGNSENSKSYKFKAMKAGSLYKVARQSDGSQFEYFRQHILRPFFKVRVPDTDGNQQVQQHIKTEMTSLGWRVDVDQFTDDTPLGRKTFCNIVAVQNPSSARRLTLACHFDSKYFENFEFIGATDSAVPCAMLIDIARLLNSAFETSKLKDTSLQLLFFDGEEAFVDWTETDSLYGARHLAAKMKNELVLLGNGSTVTQLGMMDVFILLDLIGAQTTSFRNWFSQTEKYYERLQKIEMRLAKEGLLEPANVFQSMRSNKYFTGTQASKDSNGIADDHIPFLREKVPVVHLISYPFPTVWHTSADNELALHYPTINNIGKILRVFVAEYLRLTD